MRLLVAMLFVSTAAPAIAQDHSGHAMPSAQSPAQTECEKEAERHRAMGHSVPEGACAPKAQPTEPAQDGHTGMDHSQMDHSQMDHSQMQGMDHSTMDHSKMEGMDHSAMGHGTMDMTPIPEGAPPAAAGSGPPRAADAIWGADAMRASRNALRTENGGMKVFWFQGDRAEYRAREDSDGYLWDVQGYYGGDTDKFWFKSEGEGAFGEVHLAQHVTTGAFVAVKCIKSRQPGQLTPGERQQVDPRASVQARQEPPV